MKKRFHIRIAVPENDLRLISAAASTRGETPAEFIVAAATVAARSKLAKK